MKLLKVVSIVENEDKTGLPYKTVEFTEFEAPVAGTPKFPYEVLSNKRGRVRNLWAERTLDDGSIIKADPLFAKIKEGSIVAGHIETFKTTPYMLGENEITQYTGVFFDGENSVTVATRNLRDNNANVIDTTTGEVLGVVAAPVVKAAAPTLASSTVGE